MMTSDDSASLQASTLSTLIGYITGPKAEQPVGVRVVEPPSGTRQKQRGNLYAVVDLSGNHPDHDVIADHLLTVIQRTYYAAKGSQSHVMIEAVRRAHQVLHEINLRYPDSMLRAGVLCAALLNGRLVVVASGSAMALVRVNDQVQMFPSELRMDQDANSDGDVPMQIFRQNLSRDDVMFLGGSSWLSYMPIRTLGGIVAFTNADNCADAADELYAHGGESSPPGLLIVLIDDQDAPQRGPNAPTRGTPEQPKSTSSRFMGLPTALGAAPPPRTGAQTAGAEYAPIGPPSGAQAEARSGGSATQSEQRLAASSSSTQVSSSATDAVPLALEPESLVPQDTVEQVDGSAEDVLHDADSAVVVASDTESSADGTTGGEYSEAHTIAGYAATAVVADELIEAAPKAVAQDSTLADLDSESGAAAVAVHTTTSESTKAFTDTAHEWSAKVSTAAAAGYLQTKRFLTRMLPDSSREEVGSDEKTDSAADDSDDPHLWEDRYGPPATVTARDFASYQEPVTEPEPVEMGRRRSAPPPLPEIEPYAAPAPASGTRARLFVLIALLVLILVPATVAAVYWSEGETRRNQAEQLTLAAGAKVQAAEIAIVQGDKATAREYLSEAKGYLSEAIELDGSTTERNDMAVKIDLMLQEVLQIQPLYSLVEPLLTFGPEARPQRVLVAESGIYVLDSGQQSISRYPYDPPEDVVTDTHPQVVLKQGDVIDGVTVGTLGDMAWLPLIPGVEDKPMLLVLDRNNNLFSYDPRVEGARRLELNGQETWQSASQVQTYNGRTYIADEGTNEIYRYSPGPDADPYQWFSDETLVNLAGTLAMEIDGDIWLLLSSGNILRYRSGDQGGEQLPFSLENSVGLAEDPVDMYVTKEDREEIYVADAGEDRILVYDKDGVYKKQLRAPEGDPLHGLSGIYIDEISERLFILTSGALYSHPLL